MVQQYSELYLGATVEYSEESALLTKFAQGRERLNSIETTGTERINSIETQLKKQGERINELQSVVETPENIHKRRHSDDELKQPPRLLLSSARASALSFERTGDLRLSRLNLRAKSGML